MTTGDFHDGGCLCGAIRFQVEGEPVFANHCHCVQCQKSSGAAFATWATWHVEKFRLARGVPKHFESSPRIHRSFCPECGSALFWRRLDRTPPTIDIAAGSLDDGNFLRPLEHIFTKSRQPWIGLEDRLPTFAEYRPKS